MSKHEAAGAQLESDLARLLQRVGKIEGDLRQSKNPDWPEQAIELENDEVLKGLDEMGRAEVDRIRAALARIANGTYGVCARCGSAISPERLKAIPSTVTCVACSNSTDPRRNS
jgi:RNA polymerase-binding transcription factor DksA